MTSERDKAKRWRPRFLVRTLVAAVTLVCCYHFWFFGYVAKLPYERDVPADDYVGASTNLDESRRASAGRAEMEVHPQFAQSLTVEVGVGANEGEF